MSDEKLVEVYTWAVRFLFFAVGLAIGKILS